MKRVLVGVDGSPESKKAAEAGVRLAAAMGSGVEFAHVVPEIANFAPESLYAFTATPSRSERARLMLHDLTQSFPTSGPPVEVSLLEGRPAEKLAEEATRRPDIWLVVVGHRGRGAVERALLGSVADRLAQICPKPLLVVR